MKRIVFLMCTLAALAGCGGSNSSSSGNDGSPTTVTYTFTSSAYQAAPVAVATQIGTGAYALATLASGKLTITIPHGETNYSVAWICAPTGGNYSETNEYIYQASIADGTSFSRYCFEPSSAPQTGLATVQVNAAAITGGEWVEVGDELLPWSTGTLDFNATTAVGTQDVPVGVYTGTESYNNYLAIRILRAQTIPGALNGGAPVVFGTGDEVAPQTITYNDVPNGFSAFSPLVFYQTAGGASILLNLSGPSGQYLAMPPGAVQTGDYYEISTGAQSAAGGESVGVEKLTSTGGPQSFTFSAPWSYAGPAAAALPTFDFVYSGFSGLSDVSDYISIDWAQSATSTYFIQMTATANYLNGSTSVTIPDLSSLTGFLAPAASGTAINWSAQINQGDPYLTNPPSGAIQGVGNSGTYTEP